MPGEAHFFLLGVAVTLCGWLVVHRLNRSRDRESREHEAAKGKEQRKRNFLAKMQQWKVEIDRLHTVRAGRMRNPSVFPDGISAFVGEVQMIRADFADNRRAKFDELVAQISKRKPHERDEILKSIDDLCAYVEGAIPQK